MSAAMKQKRVDELLEQSGLALKRGAVFEAERMAAKALTLAQQVQSFMQMARAVQPLREARQRRRQIACKAGSLRVIQERMTEESPIEPGCYLIQPPLVGAEARRLRMAALQSEIPVAVVCREPLTRLGLWPLVAIGPGVTVRVKVQPPETPEQPDMQWFIGAMEAIGDEAIEGLDAELERQRRIKAVIDFLDAIPEHNGLHDLLEQLCREAHAEQSRNGGEASNPTKAASRSKART